MGDDVDVRPGFNLDSTFKGHLSAVRGMLRNPNNGHMVSYDDKCIKAWTLDHAGNTQVIHSASFPSYQSTFVTALVLGTDVNMLLAACLDGNLRGEEWVSRSPCPFHDNKFSTLACGILV